MVFWVVMQCNDVVRDSRFRGSCSLP